MSSLYPKLAVALMLTALAACGDNETAATPDAAAVVPAPDANRPDVIPPVEQTVQLGPRPFYLVDDMEPSELQTELLACQKGPFEKTNFSIGHRGAAMQFPEHTKESYTAAAHMGAGIVECDVTFTSDGELVCRHAGPADALPVDENRRQDAEIGRVQRALVGMVEDEHVARPDAGIVFAVLDDVLHHLGAGRRVEHHGAAHGDDLAMRAIKPGVEVGRLVDERRAGDGRERRRLLIGDGEQAMPDHLERDRIDVLALVAAGLRLLFRQCEAHAFTLSTASSMMMLP